MSLFDGWSFDPAVTVTSALALGLYLAGVVRRRTRFPRRPLGLWRIAAFAFGVAAIVVALESPIDRLAEGSFALHMVQHLILMMVAAPALVLGEPLNLFLSAAPRPAARALAALFRSKPVHALQHPVVAWCAFTGVLWGAHYSSLYELALENESVHQFEHALFLAAALLFWYVPFAGTPAVWAARPLSQPLRIVFLLSCMAPSGFLGFSLYESGRVLYPHYLGVPGTSAPSALHDQQLGGMLMWLADPLIMLGAVLAVVAAWAREEMGRDATVMALGADGAR